MKSPKEQSARVGKMIFGNVYPMYVKKVEAKGRTKKELDEVIQWLTGYDSKKLKELVDSKEDFASFFKQAKLNKNASMITGMICGYRIEEIDDPFMKKVRYLDKLVDELAKGKKMDKILRK